MLKSMKLRLILLSVSFLTTIHVTAYWANGQSTADPLVTEEAANWIQREVHNLEKERDQLVSRLGDSHQVIRLYDERLERWSSFLIKYAKPSKVRKPAISGDRKITRLETEIVRVLENKERVEKHLEVLEGNISKLETAVKYLREAEEEKLATQVDEKLASHANDLHILHKQLGQMHHEISKLETLIQEQRIKNSDAKLRKRLEKETTHEQ